MNKEELKQEAEEYGIDNFEQCMYDDVKGWETDCKARVQAYIDGAKPRERRIEERNQKLEQIKNEKFEKALSQIKHDREVVIEYNERLQKENAEYKEVFGSCNTCKRICDMGNCCDPRTKSSYLLDKVKVITERQKFLKENTELKDCFKIAKDNEYEYQSLFTKAKEIIRSLYSIIQYRIDYENNIGIADEMWRAEQFLKEDSISEHIQRATHNYID